MKTLPIGIQSFRYLRENGYLYVDKTDIIHRLVAAGKVYFLSRPRRFGKSLLISTLEELFKGNKPLFEGLAIYDKWDWTKTYPVIRIDWGEIGHSSAEDIKKNVIAALRTIALPNQIQFSTESAPDCLRELITQLHEKTQKQVVVLIDEYDKPILDALDNPQTCKEITKFLNSFYGVLKSTDGHLRFIFLTGVSKFAGVSVFSGLNNPNDITMNSEYSSICGYTQVELENNFVEHIESVSQKMGVTAKELLGGIQRWYNGYSWDGKITVYNPFSTLMFFGAGEFLNFWFRTGTPTFLIDVLKKSNRIATVLEPICVSSSAFDGFDVEHIGEIPLLFQSG